MYLHLGQNTVIAADSIVAMFDIDAVTISKRTRDYLTAAQKKGEVVNVSTELPRSFIVCREDGRQVVYISQLSTKTLSKRRYQFT